MILKNNLYGVVVFFVALLSLSQSTLGDSEGVVVESINSENAFKYGVRIFIYRTKYETDFKVKISDHWQFVGSSLDIYQPNKSIDNLSVSMWSTGCKTLKNISYFSVKVKNTEIDKVNLALGFKNSDTGVVDRYNVDLLNYIAVMDSAHEKYNDFWRQGVGMFPDKRLLERMLSDKGCEHIGNL